MRRTFVPFALAVALMLLALPVAASPVVRPTSPGSLWSLAAVKVLDAIADLWGAIAAPDAEAPALGAQAKNDDDDGDKRDDPPSDELGIAVIPNG